jgi:hypothetical protein
VITVYNADQIAPDKNSIRDPNVKKESAALPGSPQISMPF